CWPQSSAYPSLWDAPSFLRGDFAKAWNEAAWRAGRPSLLSIDRSEDASPPKPIQPPPMLKRRALIVCQQLRIRPARLLDPVPHRRKPLAEARSLLVAQKPSRLL